MMPSLLYAESLSEKLAAGLPQQISTFAPAIAGAIGHAVPVLSVSQGMRFEYDPETGSYARRVITGGHVLVEQAETLGQSHWNLSASYEYLQFDRLGGEPLRSLSERRPFVDESGNRLVAIPTLAIDVRVQQTALNFTYGVTPWCDVQLILPVAHADLHRREDINFFVNGFDHTGVSGDATGLGDVFVRSKFALMQREWGTLSAALGVRTPTGDEDDFLGAGLTEVTPALYVASQRWMVTTDLGMRLDANLGMAFAAEDVDRSQGRWAVGLDVAWRQRIHGALALLGAHDVGSLLDQNSIDAFLCEANCGTDRARAVETSLFGIDGGRADAVALSVGVRAVLWQDSLIGFANVTIPLLDQGVVTEPVPLAGLEIGF